MDIFFTRVYNIYILDLSNTIRIRLSSQDTTTNSQTSAAERKVPIKKPKQRGTLWLHREFDFLRQCSISWLKLKKKKKKVREQAMERQKNLAVVKYHIQNKTTTGIAPPELRRHRRRKCLESCVLKTQEEIISSYK